MYIDPIRCDTYYLVALCGGRVCKVRVYPYSQGYGSAVVGFGDTLVERSNCGDQRRPNVSAYMHSRSSEGCTHSRNSPEVA